MPDAATLIARAETMAREAAAVEYPHNKRFATGLAEDVILPALLRAMAEAVEMDREERFVGTLPEMLRAAAEGGDDA